MSRRIAQNYACPAIKSLARQLLFTPALQRREQVVRAERLHDQIDPAQDYPYEFVAFRVTGHRALETWDEPLKGDRLLPDLRLLIDALSLSIDLPADESEAVETPEALAQRLSVSVKTISRWRKQGLRWRWVSDEVGQKRLVLPAGAVARFQDTQTGRVDRAARFTRMTAEERQLLVSRARRLAEAGDVSLNRVATHLARRTGRAVETVRRLLERHDRLHPRDPIFGDRAGPLSVKQRRVIARAYRLGVSVGKMAERFQRTRATIYRAIHERRAASLRQRPIEFVASPTFTRPDAQEVILGPSPALDRGTAEPHRPEHDMAALLHLAALPPSLQPLFLHPPIAADQQRSLLVRYNFLRFRAEGIRRELDRFAPRVAQLDEIESLLARAQRIADRVILANLPAILSLSLRHLAGRSERSPGRVLDLLEASQEVADQAIASFDAARGQTVEAHLIWLLLRRYATRQDERTRAARRSEGDDARLLPRYRAAAKRIEPGVDAAHL